MTSDQSALERQQLAALPGRSSWLTANAGSGKTRVLINRVTRLLFDGAVPERILCVTYTKAAASEIQTRLFAQLGKWAMLSPEDLRKSLADLGIAGPMQATDIDRARQLFARAIDAPGGLKIQTLHAFCASLLRRFPLEAGVSCDFLELDEISALALRHSVAEEIASGPDRPVFDRLADHVSGESDFETLLNDICRDAGRFAGASDPASAFARFSLPTGYDRSRLIADVFDSGTRSMMTQLVPLLESSSANDRKLAAAMSLALKADDADAIVILEDALLFGSGAARPFGSKFGDLPTKGFIGGLGRHALTD